MNGKIILSISISFFLVFGSLFYIYFDSIQSEEEINQYQDFSQSLNETSKKLFLFGSSHVGGLNSSLIVDSVHEKNNNYDFFNLATNGDTPNRRISDISYIATLNPEIIFYGVSYRDFNSLVPITSEYILPDINYFSDNQFLNI